MGKQETADLLRELTEEIKLEPVDAHRSAFTALACARGWTKARTGRYLGISRARVGQKVDKLLHYATTLETVPTLTRTMRRAVRMVPARGNMDAVVEFRADDWNDLEFARQMVDWLEQQRALDDLNPSGDMPS